VLKQPPGRVASTGLLPSGVRIDVPAAKQPASPTAAPEESISAC